jgi:phosphoribosylaminoimidazole carboxylase (NCAIR synthetase)
MTVSIKVSNGLDAYLTRTAAELGIEISAESVAAPTSNEEYLAIVAVSSAQIQLATYPAVHIQPYRNRISVKPAKLNESLLKELQISVNEMAKAQGLKGVATYRFSLTGGYLGVAELIALDSIWSLEYSLTSVFENTIRAAHGLPLGKTELLSDEWLIMNFDAPLRLDMNQSLLHLYAHDSGYRIIKATSHTGYVSLQGAQNLFEKVSHAIDYLEGEISE